MRRLQLPTRCLYLAHSFLLVLSLRSFLLEGLALGTSPSVLSLWPLLPAYVSGSLLSGKKKGLFCLLPACALSLVLLQSFGSGGKPGLDGASAAGLFLLGWRRREGGGSALTIPMLGFCIYTALRLYLRGESTQAVGARTVLLLLSGFLLLHGQGLRAGLHNAPGEPPMPWPKGIRGKNALLVLLFFALVLGLAAITPVQRGAERLLQYTVNVAEDMNIGIRKLVLTPRSPKPRPTPAIPTPRPQEDEDDWVAPPPSPLLGLVLIPGGIMGALLLLALILLPGELKKAALARIRKRAGTRRKAKDEPELYEEETEKLRDWKSLLKAARGWLHGGRQSGRKRRRWQDLPDDRARVRFVWRQLQASPAGKKLGPALTPRELGKALGAGEYQALAKQYELARYAPDSPLSPEAKEISVQALRKLRRQKPKTNETEDGY